MFVETQNWTDTIVAVVTKRERERENPLNVDITFYHHSRLISFWVWLLPWDLFFYWCIIMLRILERLPSSRFYPRNFHWPLNAGHVGVSSVRSLHGQKEVSGGHARDEWSTDRDGSDTRSLFIVFFGTSVIGEGLCWNHTIEWQKIAMSDFFLGYSFENLCACCFGVLHTNC